MNAPHYVHALVCEFLHLPGKNGLGAFPSPPKPAPENNSVAVQTAGD